jgi:ubiquitin carboxyl-terminal hydrolase 31
MGIVHHVGTLNRGHYYANIRLGPNWYEMNDEKVYKEDIKEKKNVSKTAYILLYQKMD